jgi:hypothetical protein
VSGSGYDPKFMIILMSALVGFDRLDRIFGFRIASCSFVTTEMDMEATTEQKEKTELLKVTETQIRSLAANMENPIHTT